VSVFKDLLAKRTQKSKPLCL